MRQVGSDLIGHNNLYSHNINYVNIIKINYKISELTGISNDSAKYLSLGEDHKDN